MTDIEKLAARVDELTAREEIRDVLFRYASLIDRLDAEGLKTVYHPDAVDCHWGTYIGNAHAFGDHMIKQLRGVRYVLHEITNPIITLDGDRAFVESRYTSRVRVEVDSAPPNQQLELAAHGRYLDILERREDRVWRIAHRRLARDGGSVLVVTDLGKSIPDGDCKNYPDDFVYKGFDILKHQPEHMKADSNVISAMQAYGNMLWPK